MTRVEDTQRARRLRVVMAGPLPPAIGGMATVIDDVSHSSLNQRIELILVDTAKKTPEGRPIWQGVISRLALWRLWWRKLCADDGPVVAHIHTCSGLTYFLDGTLSLLARMKGVPVVLHIHGAKFDQFLDGLSRGGLALARWLARRATRVVVLSESWEEKLSQRLPGAALHVIGNGVPVLPARQQPAKHNQTVNILFLGNLTQRKGVWELIDAMTELPEGARLSFVGGEEDPGITDKVRGLIERRALSDRIAVVGPAYGDAKYNWLEEADIFVLPSHAEGLPIALLEAMGAALPVVVTSVGAMPSVITNEQEGLIVPPDDVSALASALRRLVENEDLRKKMGEAARKRCSEGYGVERVADNYMRLYHDITGYVQAG